MRRILRAFLVALVATLVVTPVAAHADPGPWYSDAAGWRYRTVDAGTEYSGPLGTFTVRAPFFDAKHRSLGGGRGLGYPLGNEVRAASNSYYQRFERGVIYVNGGLAAVVRTAGDPVGAVHTQLGGGSGVLGVPIADVVADSSSYFYQRFENGVVYASPRGAFAVVGAGRAGTDVLAYHRALGGGTGSLGYPVGPPVREASGHAYQRFERAVVYERTVSGTASSAQVRGGFVPAHAAAGGGSGRVGYPIGEEFVGWASPQEWVQHYERATIYINAYGATVCTVGATCG